MSQPAHPFHTALSTRFVALLGVIVAASWGPLSHTLKLVEVSECGESSVRVVLAKDYVRQQAAKATAKAQTDSTKTDAKKDSARTERLLNAVPDNLEAAQGIHFELDAPLILFTVAPVEVDVARYASFEFSLPYTHPPDDTLARGPPMA